MKNIVDFNLLLRLASENDTEYPIEHTIVALAMADVPMTDAVIKLGVTLGVLDY